MPLFRPVGVKIQNAVSATLQILGTPSALVGTSSNVHSLTGVPAGTLLVLSTTNESGGSNCTVTSSPTLTWTKAADSSGGSGNAEIYTAIYTAGGSINVTSNWGSGTYQSSVCYQFQNQEPTLGGATGTAIAQDFASVTLSSTRINSFLICCTSDWNGQAGPATYRGTPTQTQYSTNPAAATFYHYYYPAASVGSYTVGYTAPSALGGAGTAVLEIRGSGAADTTPPSAPTLSVGTISSNSIDISWTTATDNVAVTGYDVYVAGVFTANVVGTTYTVTSLTASTSYAIYVKAKDAAGNGTDSNTITPTTSAAGSGFSFSNLSGDYSRPFGGSEVWNENSGAQIATGVPAPLSYYRRFTWADIEGATINSYDWTKFDSKIQAAINAGQLFSFGIMTVYPEGIHNGGFNNMNSYSGTDQKTGTTKSASSPYPLYLHTLMQGETTKDWVSYLGDAGGDWVPNYNSTNYLGRLNALYAAIYSHIQATSYVATAGPRIGQTVQYRNAIGYIDVRGHGSYGEWHHASIADPILTYMPSGCFATIATMKSIIDAHTTNLPDWPLCIIINVFDHLMFNNTKIDNQVGQYALSTSNTWGKIGLRRDQWGDDSSYYHNLLENNTETYSGPTLMNTELGNRWKFAPVIGEPPGYSSTATQSSGQHMGYFPAQATFYHAAMVGNGNYGGNATSFTGLDAVMQTAYQNAGHRIILTGGSVTQSGNFTVNLNWRNTGIAPTYHHWDVTYELRNGATVAWTNTSSFDPFLLLPSGSSTTATDVYTTPAIAAGTYGLYVIIKDHKGYMQPLPLGITGRGSDGAYFLKNVTF